MTTAVLENKSIALHRLAGIEPVPLPPSWDGAHVALRLAEAFSILKALPLCGDRMRVSLQTKWPPYDYDAEDRVAQQELDYDLDEEKQTHLRLSPSEISNANKALAWPLKYLWDHPELAKAVNAVARAHSIGRDAGWVTKKRGGFADTWRERHDLGCELIARSLQRDRVAVF